MSPISRLHLLVRLVTFTFSLFVSVFVAGCGSNDDSSRAPIAAPPVQQPAPPENRQGELNCGEVPLPKRPLQYCYQDFSNQATRPSIDAPVIYYFHGLGGNVRDLFEGDARTTLQGLVQVFGSDVPILVSLSLGSSGVLADETRAVVNVGLPAIEAQMAGGKTIRRLVMGGSMGGWNALRLVGDAPGLFKSVAALCPALSPFNGYDEAAIAAYEARHVPYLDRDFLRQALASYRQEMPTPASWDENNPFTFLDRGAYDAIPVFLSVGRQDTVGFIEGVREFKRKADARPGTNVEAPEVNGPHCVFDVPAFLAFMRRNASP